MKVPHTTYTSSRLEVGQSAVQALSGESEVVGFGPTEGRQRDLRGVPVVNVVDFDHVKSRN